MKICAIRLENVRRFTDPVEITGIGPGVNVLSAENEQGKSTIFDALHALFFKDAKSWDKEIRTLATRVGGEPFVEVEIDLKGQRYRVAKQFHKGSGKGEVRIWQGAQLFLQSDAAEAWLQELIKSPKEGGTAGLLCVRQGLTDFSDAKETLAARQDLMSSVAGEVDTITGGQRMDAIRRDVRQSLDRLVTSRGARKGGALDEAQSAVADLEAREADLAAKVQELRSQLADRQRARAELASLQDPELQQEQDQRLHEAQTDLTAAERHQEKVVAAAQALRTAQLLLESHDNQLAVFLARQKDQAEADQEFQSTTERLEQLRHALEPAEVALQRAEAAHAAAHAGATEAEADVTRLQQAERLSQAVVQRRNLAKQLSKAQELQQQMAALRAQADVGPDAKVMAAIEAAHSAALLAQQARQLAAAAITVTYEEGQEGSVLLDGQAVPGGRRLSLPDGGQLQAPGLGVIELHPVEGSDKAQVLQAQDDLAGALSSVACETLDQARSQHRQRLEAGQALREIELQLQLLAPDGVVALMQQMEALPNAPSEAGEEIEAPDPTLRAEAEAALSSARRTLEQTATQQDAARAKLAELRQAFEGANARHQSAQQRFERATAAFAGQGDSTAALSELKQRQAVLAAEVTLAQEQVVVLQQAAPDLEAAKARAQRARSVVDASRERVQELGRDLAVLDSRIATRAGEAVEEELAELRDRLLAASRGLAAVNFEVAVLRRLDQALEQARGAAQEAYVGPVLKELEPLLRLLWPGARLGVDAGQVLPDHLQRSGQDEAFDSLSGGTQEQIALLVRLAFARLLARAGRPAPVILDDAIVYTDDARIERIFDALTLQSDELQVLVFTCRQKSFRSLGGTQLSIRPVAAAG